MKHLIKQVPVRVRQSVQGLREVKGERSLGMGGGPFQVPGKLGVVFLERRRTTSRLQASVRLTGHPGGNSREHAQRHGLPGPRESL